MVATLKAGRNTPGARRAHRNHLWVWRADKMTDLRGSTPLFLFLFTYQTPVFAPKPTGGKGFFPHYFSAPFCPVTFFGPEENLFPFPPTPGVVILTSTCFQKTIVIVYLLPFYVFYPSHCPPHILRFRGYRTVYCAVSRIIAELAIDSQLTSDVH